MSCLHFTVNVTPIRRIGGREEERGREREREGAGGMEDWVGVDVQCLLWT